MELQRDGQDTIDRISKFVSINSTRSKETQVHIMLHEAGHVLVGESAGRFNGEAEVLNKYSSKTKIHKTFTVIEEIEAWKLGRNLGDITLNHFIDHNKFDKMMTECIMSYLYWATEEEDDTNST